MTTIIIEKETKNKLLSIGHKKQTYDDIINELIELKKRSVDLAESTEQEML